MGKKGGSVGGFVFNLFNVGFTVVMFLLPTVALGYWYLYIRKPAKPVAVQQQVVAETRESKVTAPAANPKVPNQPSATPPQSSFFSEGPAVSSAEVPASEPLKRINERDTYEMRMWSDPSGKFSVSARFFSAIGDEIKLITADERRIDVPIAKLCEGDKEYLRALFKKKGVRAKF